MHWSIIKVSKWLKVQCWDCLCRKIITLRVLGLYWEIVGSTSSHQLEMQAGKKISVVGKVVNGFKGIQYSATARFSLRQIYFRLRRRTFLATFTQLYFIVGILELWTKTEIFDIDFHIDRNGFRFRFVKVSLWHFIFRRLFLSTVSHSNHFITDISQYQNVEWRF